MKTKIFILFYLSLYGCGNIKQSQIINKEQTFFFKGHVNLYLTNNKKEVVKKFYEFSNIEKIARQNVKFTCSNYIKINKLNNVKCIYMGTKHTERMLTSLSD